MFVCKYAFYWAGGIFNKSTGLHHGVATCIFFWSSGIMDCILFTFKNRVLLMR